MTRYKSSGGFQPPWLNERLLEAWKPPLRQSCYWLSWYLERISFLDLPQRKRCATFQGPTPAVRACGAMTSNVSELDAFWRDGPRAGG